MQSYNHCPDTPPKLHNLLYFPLVKKLFYITVDGKQIQVEATKKTEAIPLFEKLGYEVTCAHIKKVKKTQNPEINPGSR